MTTNDRAKAILRQAAASIGSPVWRRLKPRIETIAAHAAQRASDHADRLAQPLREDLERLRGELGSLRQEMRTLQTRMDHLEHHNRYLPEQLAAVEARIGTLEAGARTGSVPTAEPSADAWSLLDEIRNEHLRVSARLSAVAAYEERIARLENALQRSNP